MCLLLPKVNFKKIFLQYFNYCTEKKINETPKESEVKISDFFK